LKILFTLIILIFNSGLSQAQNKKIIGEWNQTKKNIDQEDIKMKFSSTTMGLTINSETPYSFKYKLSNDYIKLWELESKNFVDSIQVIKITKKKLILKVKEKGMYYNRKYLKIKNN
jgi:hypothetical protein